MVRKGIKTYRGLVHKWKKYELQAYEKLGDINNQRELALEFLYGNDFSYYAKLKELYEPNEWKNTLQKIMITFENQSYIPSAYVEILKVEKLHSKLLEYCKEHLSSIQSMYTFLIEDYFEEVNGIFNTFIEMEAEHANDRKKYRNVCGLIKAYKKACGDINADKLADNLKHKYKRKPAFVEELERFMAGRD